MKMVIEPKMDIETEFLSGLLELQYGQDVVKKLKKLSRKVSWANNWPQNDQSFWNAEAFMWQKKISKVTRNLICNELKVLNAGKNLDLGCGAYSYIPSIGFDLSEKMLHFNDNCLRKVKGNMEKKLPFKDAEFNSVTAVFVLNYVKNLGRLLSEVRRILKIYGKFVSILSAKEVNDWQKKKEINSYSGEEWSEFMRKNGFYVQFNQKKNLWFFTCTNRHKP